MRSPTEVAYLAALSLTLSIVEAGLPQAIPFLRIGLANLVLLWALERLCAKDYLTLAALKWFLSCLVSGILISPYALVSLSGNAASALAMLLVHKIAGNRLSLYSVSALGAWMSALAQMGATSLIISATVMRLLPFMLVFNTAAGLVTAFIALRLEPARDVRVEGVREKGRTGWASLILFLVAILALALTDGIATLAFCFALALLSCHMAGRRIRPVPYIIAMVGIIVFSLLAPSGRVLWLFVTEGALREGLSKALRLSAMVALSQTMTASVSFSSLILGEALAINASLSALFSRTEGSIRKRLTEVLSCRTIVLVQGDRRGTTAPVTVITLAITLLAIISRLCIV